MVGVGFPSRFMTPLESSRFPVPGLTSLLLSRPQVQSDSCYDMHAIIGPLGCCAMMVIIVVSRHCTYVRWLVLSGSLHGTFLLEASTQEEDFRWDPAWILWVPRWKHRVSVAIETYLLLGQLRRTVIAYNILGVFWTTQNNSKGGFSCLVLGFWLDSL